MNNNNKTIHLAGGCFWGMQGYFNRIRGVMGTKVGYANGKGDSTNYERVKETDHAETVEITYDKSLVSLEEILLRYFKVIDPKSVNKQGGDRGRQYRTGIYYSDPADKKIIDKVYKYEEKIHGELAVEVEELKNFVLAEGYHQDYLEKNPGGYCHINLAEADEPIFEKEYKEVSDEEAKKLLDELSYKVMREEGTEHPHTSELNDEWRAGIYVDKLTGEVLFTSQDKFDAGCGWPSFARTINSDSVSYNRDESHGMRRVEIKSKFGKNHLGHVFSDGPKEMGGLRYCIDGAALRFVPLEDMDKEGYGEYKIFFADEVYKENAMKNVNEEPKEVTEVKYESHGNGDRGISAD